MVTNISLSQILSYLRLDTGDEQQNYIKALKDAAIGYIMSYTGQPIEYIDTRDEFVPVFYTLISDMYEVRQFTVTNDKINPVAKTILDMHSINLL